MKLKKINFCIIHLIAECEDCDWCCEDYMNGKMLAAAHAKKYKHKVTVEAGSYGVYDGRVKN